MPAPIPNPNAFFLYQPATDLTQFLRLDRLTGKAARVVFNGRVAPGMPDSAEIEVMPREALVAMRDALTAYLDAP